MTVLYVFVLLLLSLYCIYARSVHSVLESILRVQPARHIRPPIDNESSQEVRCVGVHTEPSATQQRRKSNHIHRLQQRRHAHITVWYFVSLVSSVEIGCIVLVP